MHKMVLEVLGRRVPRPPLSELLATVDNVSTGGPVEINKKEPSQKGPAHNFTGDVWFDVVAKGQEPSRLRVNKVRFAPGARTAWHSHAVGQTLHVTDGVGRVQSRGGEVVEMRAGDTIHTPPGEWHWHGAAPEHFMAHLAMWEAPSSDSASEVAWGDAVTDEEYLGST